MNINDPLDRVGTHPPYSQNHKERLAQYIQRNCADVPRNDREELGDYAIRILTSYKVLIEDTGNLIMKQKEEFVGKIEEKTDYIEFLEDRVSSLEEQIKALASSEV